MPQTGLKKRSIAVQKLENGKKTAKKRQKNGALPPTCIKAG